MRREYFLKEACGPGLPDGGWFDGGSTRTDDLRRRDHDAILIPAAPWKTAGQGLGPLGRLSAQALGFLFEELPEWHAAGVYPMAKDEIATGCPRSESSSN